MTENKERNAALCKYYQEGHSISESARYFGISRGCAQQILMKAGVWKPFKGTRTEYVGINVTPAIKERVIAQADDAGVSLSRYVSDMLEFMVAEE